MRNLRILKVIGLHYDDCIRHFYRKHQFLKDLRYQDHYEYLEQYCPVHMNSFRLEMEALGNEAKVVIFDLESLQMGWADEFGYEYSKEQWRVDILLEQIKRYEPEVIYLQDVVAMPHFVRKRLRDFCPSIKKVVVFKGSQGAYGELNDTDHVFCGLPIIQENFDKDGVSTSLLYHSFDESILGRLDAIRTQSYSSCFLGYSGYGGFGAAHTARYNMLCELAEKTDMTFWPSENLARQDMKDVIPFAHKYPDKCKPSCFGLELYSIIRNSGVALNKHADAADPNVGNMRMFEVTGVGTCMLTNTGTNMNELFEPDSEVVTYNSTEECLEKLQYLNDNPKVRDSIGKAGQERALKDHSLKVRCQQISEEISALFD